MEDTSNLMGFDTWLPVFPGFYNTIFEPQLDGEADHYMNEGVYINKFKTALFDDQDKLMELLWETFDNSAYELEVCKGCCEVIEESCDLIDSIEFQNESSPKEYNFHNDSINCKIIVKMDELIAWIYENKDFLNNYFKSNYTSCDGFISRFPNNFEEWEIETKKFTELDNHYLGSILNAWCKLNEVNDTTLYYSIEINAGNYVDTEKLIEIASDRGIFFVMKNTDPDQFTILI